METIDRRLAAGWVVHDDDAATTMGGPDGIAATARYLDGDEGRLFTVTHLPAAAPVGGVVVCSPVLAEAMRNQRRELVLGWELSAAGFAVTRFHYHGSGNSDGDPETMTFDRLVADAVRIADDVARRHGLSRVAFVGTRLGALVAAAAAAEHPGTPLVLWEPPVDPERYFNEVFRARMIGLLKRGEPSPSSREMMDAFAAAGVMDVVGSPLAHSLYETVRHVDPVDLIVAAGPRPVLAVQLAVRAEVRPGLAALAERCRSAGVAVETAAVEYDEAWWFGATGYTVVEVAAGALDAIPATVAFLTRDAP